MKRIFLAILICLVVSCGEKLIEKPDNLIPRDKIVQIYQDIILLNAAKSTNSKVLVENNITLMPYVYKKYNIDSVQLTQSDQYYAADPALYEELHKEVNTKLEELKSELEERRETVVDSIKKSEEQKVKKGAKDRLIDKKTKISLPESEPK